MTYVSINQLHDEAAGTGAYTTWWKLSDIFFGLRSRLHGSADGLDLFVGSTSSSFCLLSASIHGVLTRMLVESRYTPSVRFLGVVCSLRAV